VNRDMLESSRIGLVWIEAKALVKVMMWRSQIKA